MDTIKLQAPQGVTAASFAGQEYKVGKDGVVEVPVDAALTLYGFGFGNAPEAVAKTRGSKATTAEANPVE